MATLDRVIQMQNEGKTDTEIMAQLQNEGIQPGEINQSLQQAKIKNAVSQAPNTQAPEGMTPSITEQIPTQQQTPQEQPITESTQQQSPSPTQTASPQPMTQPQQQPQYPEYDPYQQAYPQTPQAYQQDQGYYPQESYSTETISEIATQIATETLDDYKEKIGDMLSFKNEIKNKVEDLDDRLKKIENSIDKLQQAIIGKIGEYSDTTAMIHHDLDNLHGTVAKLMNPLIDNIETMNSHKKKSKK